MYDAWTWIMIVISVAVGLGLPTMCGIHNWLESKKTSADVHWLKK